jgi:hypothetical protein
MLYWDKQRKQKVFLNYKDIKDVQIQRLGEETFPIFEFMSRDEFDKRYEKFQNR